MAAWRGDSSSAAVAAGAQGRWRIVVTLLAVTWLNPHVYLDTFVVLGSLGGQLLPDVRPWFAFGAVSASVAWFLLWHCWLRGYRRGLIGLAHSG